MMARLQVGSVILAAALVLGINVDSSGQTVGNGHLANGNQILSSKTLRVLNFYGASAQSTAPLRQIPVRPASAPTRPRLPKNKPFSTDVHRPAVSPFLNMFRDDNLESAPNYFAFVRPQLRQQQFAESQRFENQQLRRQVRRASISLGLSPGSNTSLPTTGHATRFMNVGGYYRGAR